MTAETEPIKLFVEVEYDADTPIRDLAEKLYGVFSEQAAQRHGSVWYATPDGGEVEVTSVASSPSQSQYRWPDKKYVGVVTKYLRRGRKGTWPNR